MQNNNHTIYALATHPGKSGVSIIRISGTNAMIVVQKLCKRNSIIPRKANFLTLHHPDTNEVIDQSVVIYFASPHSFTGEDIVELHIHGSPAIINILIDILGKFNNFRIAQPGEFARRAFLNNKMDLTQSEGLVDLINAETIIQHKQAIRQYAGELEKLYESWRKDIIKILANIEAYLDFPDEEIPEDTTNTMNLEIKRIKSEIENHLMDNRRGEKLRNGLYVAIVGKPNVGKSSLLNYLAKRDVVIVSDIAGTTRDIVEIHLDLEGYPITIADTAGIRESDDLIEAEGIKRAINRSKSADFNIVMFDKESSLPDRETMNLINKNAIIIVNKLDLNMEFDVSELMNPIFISLKTGEGINLLMDKIKLKAEELMSPTSSPQITRERYRFHLTRCLENLNYFNLENDLELAVEDLRLAAREIGAITGNIDIDTILDEIFSSFCIGK